MYLQEKIDLLEIPSELVDRYVNQGFSGGEKKRNEILQMAVLRARAGDHGRDGLGPRHRRPQARLAPE